MRNDFKPEQIEELICLTGAVYVLIDGEMTGSSYPTRSFCILEFSSAVKGKTIIMIETPDDGPLAPPSNGCCGCSSCGCTNECCHPISKGSTMPG